MNKFVELYQAKKKTPEELAMLVKSGDICACPTCIPMPQAIVKAIGDRARKGEIEGVQHHQLLTIAHADFFDPELKGKYDGISWFTSAAGRKGVQQGLYDYVPNHYSTVTTLWQNCMPRLDVFYTQVSPMDKHGYFSCGMTAAEVSTFMAKANIVLVEVNEHMPRVFGSHLIHISEVTGLCEFSAPLPELKNGEMTEKDLHIGHMIADLIPNGATLQLGIGGIPNAVGICLREKQDLGLHTEMFTDSMVDLLECGAVTNKKKPIHQGKTIATFAWGSQKMYDYVDDNPSFEMYPVDYVNNPYVISQHDNFISVNSCVEIDLFGQVCAESMGPVLFSGSGGQVDFVRGANLSKGGKGFIAMYSTAKNGTVSKIKPILTPGSVVTTGRNDVDYIVTEHGVVQLKGKTAGERARLLISIADPKFRDELKFEAKKMNLMI
jgi:4-hydroxybutyrate CoA-transferase